jgi:uncharacterized membrane protein
MKKRPLSITIIGWIFIAAGTVGLLYHLTELRAKYWFSQELILICFVRILAIVAGIFLLRGFNWARRLLVLWLAYHVVLSAFHSLMEVIVHGLLLIIITYFLYRRAAAEYFRDSSSA